jgi:hypothetical protein
MPQPETRDAGFYWIRLDAEICDWEVAQWAPSGDTGGWLLTGNEITYEPADIEQVDERRVRSPMPQPETLARMQAAMLAAEGNAALIHNLEARRLELQAMVNVPVPETNHDGETLVQAKDRYLDDWEDLGDKHTKSRGRYGWFDLMAGHASTNVAVTFAREQPRAAGHWLANSVRINVVLFMLAVAGWAWALVQWLGA